MWCGWYFSPEWFPLDDLSIECVQGDLSRFSSGELHEGVGERIGLVVLLGEDRL